MGFSKGHKPWQKSGGKGDGREKKLAELDWKYLERLSFASLTDRQMAISLGVHVRTWYRWKELPEVQTVLTKGVETKGASVESSMYQAAQGFTYDEETWEAPEATVYDDKKKRVVRLSIRSGKLKLTKRVRKHFAPNVLAGIFLLTNWKPDEYKHKGAIEGGDVPAIVINDLIGMNLFEMQRLRERINKVRRLKELGEGVKTDEPPAKPSESEASEKEATEPERTKAERSRGVRDDLVD